MIDVSAGRSAINESDLARGLMKALANEAPGLLTVCDGVVRVGTTRVTLDTVVQAYLEGLTAETIADQYPTVGLAQVYSVIGAYLRHQPSVDAYLRARSSQGDAVKSDNERRFDSVGVKDRLLARRRDQV